LKRSIIPVLLAGALAVTGSAAAHGKGRPGGHGTGCKAQVSYVFEGTFDSSADSSSFVMDVVHANRHARSLVGSQATVVVSDSTRIRRDDVEATLADLVPGDEVNVQVKNCMGQVPAQLSAVRVAAESADDAA
jgi:hypothetical protein